MSTTQEANQWLARFHETRNELLALRAEARQMECDHIHDDELRRMAVRARFHADMALTTEGAERDDHWLKAATLLDQVEGW